MRGVYYFCIQNAASEYNDVFIFYLYLQKKWIMALLIGLWSNVPSDVLEKYNKALFVMSPRSSILNFKGIRNKNQSRPSSMKVSTSETE